MKDFFQLVLCSRTDFLSFLPQKINTLEIGVQAGNYSAEIIAKVNPTAHYMIDPYMPVKSGDYIYDNANAQDNEILYTSVLDRFSRSLESKQSHFLRMTSAEALEHLPDEYFDFIYIDAMHYYDAVLFDLFSYSKKLKKYGVLAGHDYANHQNARNQKFGVIEAVKEFTDKTEFNLNMITWEDWPSYFLSRNNSPFMNSIATKLPFKKLWLHSSLKDKLLFEKKDIVLSASL